MEATRSAQGVTLVLEPTDIEPFREMLRQQLLGDQELLRDCIAGREDPETRLEVYDRIQTLRPVADVLGLPEDPERRRTRRVNARPRTRLPEYITPSGPVFALIALVTIGFQALVVLTGNDFGFGFFYAPIIAATSLRYGRRAGFFGSAMAAAMISLVAHLTFKGSHEGLVILSTLIPLAAFTLLAWVTARERLITWL